MKNIIVILGGAQILLDISFDPEILFEEQLTVEHCGFQAFLRVIEDYIPILKQHRSRTGRPRYDDLAIF